MGSVFQHSVASGDPLQDRVILWTRVTTDANEPVETTWTLARDAAFEHIVATGTAVAEAERDHTVHVDATGLEPGTHYWYRFDALGESSDVARTKTLPGAGIGRTRFAMVSCASYNAGFFNAYARIADREDLDFLLHLGDYIYETPNVLPPSAPQPPEMGRPFDPANECVTLEDYRTRYAQYRRDPDVRALHLIHPIIATIDDHEYADGAWREGSSWHRPDQGPYMARKATAIRARWEWMPCRVQDPNDPEHVYHSFAIGDLADVFLTDTRTHRDQPVPPPAMCEPQRTKLGPEQRDWLLHEIDASTARWRVFANPSVMGQTFSEKLPEPVRAALAKLKLVGDDGSGAQPDQWDGYPAERSMVLRHIEDHGYDNLVVLSGDVHVGLAIELHDDSFAGREPIAAEFVTSSLTSMNLDDKMGWPRRSDESLALAQQAVDAVPHWKWAEFDSNGYVLIDLTPDRLIAEYWFVDTVLEPSTHEDCQARFLVEHGRPYIRPAP